MADLLSHQQARDLAYRIDRDTSWWTARPVNNGPRAGWAVTVKWRQHLYHVRCWDDWERIRRTYPSGQD